MSGEEVCAEADRDVDDEVTLLPPPKEERFWAASSVTVGFVARVAVVFTASLFENTFNLLLPNGAM